MNKKIIFGFLILLLFGISLFIIKDYFSIFQSSQNQLHQFNGDVGDVSWRNNIIESNTVKIGNLEIRQSPSDGVFYKNNQYCESNICDGVQVGVDSFGCPLYEKAYPLLGSCYDEGNKIASCSLYITGDVTCEFDSECNNIKACEDGYQACKHAEPSGTQYIGVRVYGVQRCGGIKMETVSSRITTCHYNIQVKNNDNLLFTDLYYTGIDNNTAWFFSSKEDDTWYIPLYQTEQLVKKTLTQYGGVYKDCPYYSDEEISDCIILYGNKGDTNIFLVPESEIIDQSTHDKKPIPYISGIYNRNVGNNIDTLAWVIAEFKVDQTYSSNDCKLIQNKYILDIKESDFEITLSSIDPVIIENTHYDLSISIHNNYKNNIVSNVIIDYEIPTLIGSATQTTETITVLHRGENIIGVNIPTTKVTDEVIIKVKVDILFDTSNFYGLNDVCYPDLTNDLFNIAFYCEYIKAGEMPTETFTATIIRDLTHLCTDADITDEIECKLFLDILVNDLENNITNSESQIADLISELDISGEQIAILLLQLDKVNQNITQIVSELQISNDKIATLLIELDNVNANITQITNKLIITDEQLKVIIIQLQHADDEILSLTAQLDLSEQQLLNLIIDLDLAEQDIAKYILQLALKDDELASLIADLAAKDIEISNIITELNLKDVELAKLIVDLDNANIYIGDLLLKIQLNQQQLDTIIIELNTANIDVARLIEEALLNNQETATLITMLDLKENELVDILFQLQLTEEDLADTITQLNLTKQELSSLIIELGLKDVEIASLISQIDFVEQELYNTIICLNLTEQELSNKIQELNLTEQQIAELIGRLDLKDQEIASLINQLQNLNMTELINELDLKECELASLLNEMTLLNIEIDDLIFQLNLSNYEIDLILKKMATLSYNDARLIEQLDAENQKLLKLIREEQSWFENMLDDMRKHYIVTIVALIVLFGGLWYLVKKIK